MTHQITQGIKISVETLFNNIFYKDHKINYAFNYKITIENQSNDTVQLLSRHWEITDALNFTEIVDGRGVIGITPILKPKTKHTYNSGCLLISPLGSMKGFYTMFNFSSNQKFKVIIPSFKLTAPFAIN
jgi:ApaG protein